MPAKKNVVNKNITDSIIDPIVEQVVNTEPVIQDSVVELNKSKSRKNNKKSNDVVFTENKSLNEDLSQKGGEEKEDLLQNGGGEEIKKKRGRKTAEVKDKEINDKEVKGVKVKVKKSNKKSQKGGEGGEDGDDGDESEKRIRSFKVKLPDKEDYEGRFTGLTPYQAANKALSKYFRENKSLDGDNEVSFSIVESTRKSDKHTYTYIGKRYKLEVPVVYKIKDANGESREIVKNFKNVLKKVKKSDQ